MLRGWRQIVVVAAVLFVHATKKVDMTYTSIIIELPECHTPVADARPAVQPFGQLA